MKRILVALSTLALVVAACGSSEPSGGVASLDDSTSTTGETSDNPTVGTEEAVLAFTECLRAEGLDVVDPDFDGEGGFNFDFREGFRLEGGGPNEEFRGALEVCGELLEDVRQQFERPDISEIQDDLLAFAECMRGNGVDVADPDFSGRGPGPGGGGPLFDFDFSDPAVEAALEACQSELAFGRPGGDRTGVERGGS